MVQTDKNRDRAIMDFALPIELPETSFPDWNRTNYTNLVPKYPTSAILFA